MDDRFDASRAILKYLKILSGTSRDNRLALPEVFAEFEEKMEPVYSEESFLESLAYLKSLELVDFVADGESPYVEITEYGKSIAKTIPFSVLISVLSYESPETREIRNRLATGI